MQTVQAIDRALPVLHSGPGCAQKLSESTGSSGYFSPNIFPCTSINEKDVVFGGVKKLETTIENALKVIDADLYVVLTGCIPQIVGDDTEEVVSKFADSPKPVINKQFTTVADAQYSLAVTKFLVNDLGLVPARQYVVDDTPKDQREAIAQEFKNLNYGIQAEVSFETDGFKIHEEIKQHDYHGYPLILGGYYEKEVTESLKGNFLNISWPVQDKVVLDDSYVGYTGGIRLIEDIYTVAVQRFN